MLKQFEDNHKIGALYSVEEFKALRGKLAGYRAFEPERYYQPCKCGCQVQLSLDFQCPGKQELSFSLCPECFTIRLYAVWTPTAKLVELYETSQNFQTTFKKRYLVCFVDDEGRARVLTSHHKTRAGAIRFADSRGKNRSICVVQCPAPHIIYSPAALPSEPDLSRIR